MHGVDIGGAGTGNWTIGGNALADQNQFLGNSKTAGGAGIRIRSTLPASYVGLIKKNVLTGWDRAILRCPDGRRLDDCGLQQHFR